MDVYRRNNCIVISDEIWSDLILEGQHHIPDTEYFRGCQKQNDCCVCAIEDV